MDGKTPAQTEGGGPIIVIVKAANQSVPDQRLECDAECTVADLKSRLSVDHPSKPRVEEQRLIYSGQLLADDSKLRGALRHPPENNAYTIHLVCSPPRHPAGSASTSSQPSPRRMATTATPPQDGGAPPPGSLPETNGESTDGLRRRNINSTTIDGGAPTQQGIEAAAGYPPQAPPAVSVGVIHGTAADPIQQMATMQQMYANYMAYMQYIQMGGGALTGAFPWPQQMLHLTPPANPTTTAASTSTVEPTDPPQAAEEPDVDGNPQQQPQPQPAAAVPPQIRLNAQGGEVDDDEDNEGLGRDWLDWVYVLSRMIVLLSVVYFYSTIWKFMVVVCIALLVYLYQAGWFRPTRRAPEQLPPPPQQARQEANDGLPAQDDRNNNINNNNNNNNVAEQLVADGGGQAAAAAAPEGLPAADGGEGTGGGDVGGLEAEGLHVRPSLLALSWTFLTTFFTSLIPEQPQVI